MAAESVTIVTAFFDIGRGDWVGYANGTPIAPYIQRSTETYLERFKALTKLDNKIIVFTESKFSDIIKEMRDDIIIVEYDEIFSENYNLMEELHRIMRNRDFIKLIDSPASPEYWSPKYVLINFYKSLFVEYVINNNIDDANTLAWIDFGYVRDDTRFVPGTTWKFDTNNKINLFNIRPLDDRPIFDIVMSGDVYIQGCHIVSHREGWSHLRGLMLDSLSVLTRVGMIDDDQTMLLMSFRTAPHLFSINYIDPNKDGWFVIFKDFNHA